MKSAVVLLSGGMDSTVLAYYLAKRVERRPSLHALTLSYGQRHRKETGFAQRTADRLGLKYLFVPLASGLIDVLRGSALTSAEVAVPRGHYADPAMKATVVPNRNMIMLAVAAGYAVSRGLEAVAYAAHAGDYAVYPDCRPTFIKALALALTLGTEGFGADASGAVTLLTPFVDHGMSKGDIVRWGADLGVPFEETWTCYVGGDVHCGACGACVERRESFTHAGVPDPTVYAQ